MSAKPRPLPKPDADSTPFWDAARVERLEVQRCTECRSYRFYPRLLCPTCWSQEAEWVRVSGRGTLYSFSIVHRAPHPAFAEFGPYAVCLVDLEEGVRMFGRIVGDLAALAIGERVQVEFEAVSAQITLPVFRRTA